MKLTASYFDRVRASAQAASERLDTSGVEVAIVLGSGLAPAVAGILESRSVPYCSLPGFPETTVAGHPGRLVCGTWAGRRVLAFCGRVHGYEGYSPCEVGFGIRVAAALGVRTAMVTNVSGGIDPAFKVGELVLISDHVNLTGQSPLAGPNDERLGARFPDMTDVYTPALRTLATETGRELFGRPLREAVYAAMPGPSYETPAEVRMLRIMGAGLVGMSTVFEVIAARHAGLAVLGVSLVANPAAGVEREPLNHEDVTRAASAGAGRLGLLLETMIGRLPPVGTP